MSRQSMGVGEQGGRRTSSPPSTAISWDQIHNRIISYRDEAVRIAKAAGLSSPSRILDLGCGNGGHILELAAQGHWCVGLDRGVEKLVAARRRSRALGLSAQFVCADIRASPLSNRYDLVLCMYGMSAMRGEQDVLAVLCTARAALEDGGMFIFNVIHRHANADPRSPVHALVYRHNYLRDFTVAEVEDLLTRTRFRLQSIRYVDVANIRDLDMQVYATMG